MIEADFSMTDAAFAAMNGETNAGDDQLLVRFFLDPVQDEQATKEQGRPIFKEAIWVDIAAPGQRGSVAKRVARPKDIQRFPRHYEAFRNRTDGEQMEGTPLDQWPGLIRSQVEELKFFNIRTVEQLASVADSSLTNFRGAVMLKEKAKAYLEASKGNATAEALIEAKKKNEELEAKVEALMNRLDSMEDEPKPKRKRRTKAEMEAQE